MAKKYYAVKEGRKKGVLESWDRCKASVDGFPNAIYKSFSNYNDAYVFAFGENKNSSDENLNNENPEVFAYIDGSYDDSQKRFSYAGIIFNKGKKISFSNSNNNRDLVELRNVAGELYASMFVMDYAKKNNVKNITIYYDYVGIEMWATGKWKANLEFTQKYSIYSKEIMKDINIIFKKVKAHSGIQYNEEVDKLAKLALKQCNHSENNIRINDISTSDEGERDIFVNIKSSKNFDKFCIFTGKDIISPDDLLISVKSRWKERKRKIKEIKEIKSYYNAVKNQFIVMIITEKDENIITIESSEFYGKK